MSFKARGCHPCKAEHSVLGLGAHRGACRLGGEGELRLCPLICFLSLPLIYDTTPTYLCCSCCHHSVILPAIEWFSCLVLCSSPYTPSSPTKSFKTALAAFHHSHAMPPRPVLLGLFHVIWEVAFWAWFTLLLPLAACLLVLVFLYFFKIISLMIAR